MTTINIRDHIDEEIKRNPRATKLQLTPTTYTALLVALGYSPENGDLVDKYRGLDIYVDEDEEIETNEQIRVV